MSEQGAIKEPSMSMYSGAVAVTDIRRNSDAVTLLKADHRHVEDLFFEIERTHAPAQKQKLAIEICEALAAHSVIEEEIFYPAFLAATQCRELHHEAIVEHDESSRLMAEIRLMSAEHEYFEAKIHVLSEMIAHHFREEERIGGMFSTARKSSMDLVTLGQAMQQRKSELLGSSYREA
jgi:hemerythrin superfamily protein